MTLDYRFGSRISTGDNGHGNSEEKLGEKADSSFHGWLPSESLGDVSRVRGVGTIIEGQDQTKAATLGKCPVTKFAEPIEILSELEKIGRLLQDLFDQFDEEDLRQLTLVEIKKTVARSVKVAIHYGNYFSQSITLLEDGLSFIRSESMTKDQVNAAQDVVQILKKVSLDRENARQCGRILRKYKVTTLPNID